VWAKFTLLEKRLSALAAEHHIPHANSVSSVRVFPITTAALPRVILRLPQRLPACADPTGSREYRLPMRYGVPREHARNAIPAV
jgi:hypothetical protein